MKNPLIQVTLAVLLLLPLPVFAWGAVGHHAICEMAYAELNPGVRAEVDRLIALDPDYDDFATSCTFADWPERQRPIEHYINVPRSVRSIATLDCPMAEDCVLTAIGKDLKIVRDRTQADAERLLALKLLGHWVGDLHQPMHVGYEDDQGANWVPNVGVCERNLHATWDSCIIETLLGEDFREIAARLHRDIRRDDREDWSYDTPVEWANESYRIAISPATRYCVDKQDACWYEDDNFLLSPGETQRTLTIRRSYLKRHQKTVEMRLKQAAVRLGYLLNRALESEPIMEQGLDPTTK